MAAVFYFSNLFSKINYLVKLDVFLKFTSVFDESEHEEEAHLITFIKRWHCWGISEGHC